MDKQFYKLDSQSSFARLVQVAYVTDGVIRHLWTVDYNNPNTAGHDYMADLGQPITDAIEMANDDWGCQTHCGYCAACNSSHTVEPITNEQAILEAANGRRWRHTVIPITAISKQ